MFDNELFSVLPGYRCLLPGKVRSIGVNQEYMLRRSDRPFRLTEDGVDYVVSELEILGGGRMCCREEPKTGRRFAWVETTSAILVPAGQGPDA